MSFIDDAKAAATMAVPGPGAPDEVRAAFDAMSIVELAARWRMLQFVGVKEQTADTWTATRYFDDLPHESPARAYDMVRAVLAAETDMSVRLRLHDVMSTLVHAHGAMLVDRIEADAADNADLRWLLGRRLLVDAGQGDGGAPCGRRRRRVVSRRPERPPVAKSADRFRRPVARGTGPCVDRADRKAVQGSRP